MQPGIPAASPGAQIHRGQAGIPADSLQLPQGVGLAKRSLASLQTPHGLPRDLDPWAQVRIPADPFKPPPKAWMHQMQPGILADPLQPPPGFRPLEHSLGSLQVSCSRGHISRVQAGIPTQIPEASLGPWAIRAQAGSPADPCSLPWVAASPQREARSPLHPPFPGDTQSMAQYLQAGLSDSICRNQHFLTGKKQVSWENPQATGHAEPAALC